MDRLDCLLTCATCNFNRLLNGFLRLNCKIVEIHNGVDEIFVVLIESDFYTSNYKLITNARCICFDAHPQ